MVTNTAWENLIKASNSLEISVSELIGRVGRNMYGNIKKDDCD
jgi:hypothetical protein